MNVVKTMLCLVAITSKANQSISDVHSVLVFLLYHVVSPYTIYTRYTLKPPLLDTPKPSADSCSESAVAVRYSSID